MRGASSFTFLALVSADYSCPWRLSFFRGASSPLFHPTIVQGFVEQLLALANTCYHLSFQQTLVMPFAVRRCLPQVNKTSHGSN